MGLMNLNGQNDYKLIDGLVVFPKTLAVHREDGKALGFMPKGTEGFPGTAEDIMNALVDENGKKIKDNKKATVSDQYEDQITAHPHEIKLQKMKEDDRREKAGLPSLEEQAELDRQKQPDSKSKKKEAANKDASEEKDNETEDKKK